MNIEIILKDGAKFLYTDVTEFEFNEIDNSVYFIVEHPGMHFDSHAFVNVLKVIMKK